MKSRKPTTRAARSSRRRRLSIGASLGAAMVAVAVLASCGGEESKQVSDRLDSQLQQMLDSAVDSPETVFPGTALYVSQPELGTWAGAAGQGNIDPATPMRAEDTFRAGSIMKPFVAATILQLAEEGAFALDDPLPAVLARDVVARIGDADRITVRMLLNHTSGIAEFNDDEFEHVIVAADPHRVWEDEEFLDRAAARPPAFAPGKRWGYSNTNYTLLGLIIEEATGESWRAVVRDRVIDRLDLEHTSLPEPGDLSIGSDAAHGYVPVNGELHDFTDIDPSVAGAAGGHALVTTTEDLARFLDALLAGQLFEQPETLDEMLTFVEAKEEGSPVGGYGLGIERYRFPGGLEVIGHAGSTGGYFAFVGHAPAKDLDIAMVITNSDYSPLVLMPALELMVAEAS
jgi:D-alanyl-D-alanine carboxypeptidase